MAKHSIKVLPIAQEDMKAIIAHIRLHDPDAAVRMMGRIRESIAKLADYPFMGPVPTDPYIAERGYRMLIVEPYLVFYLVVMDDRTVEIHRVLHHRQHYPSALN